MRAALLAGIILSGLTFAPALGQDEAVPDLRPFLRHAEPAAAIAEALGHIDDCMAPLDFRFAEAGDRWSIILVCADGLSAVQQVTVEFQVHPVSGDWPYLEPVEILVETAERDD